MKVMFTDDESETLEVYAKIFQSHNFEVVTFDDAREAIEHQKSNPVDVIIADIFMPGCNGIEFFKRLRDECDFTGSFAFLTGKWQAEYGYLLSEGVDKVLQNPVAIDDLLSYLKEKEKAQKDQ